MCQRTGANGYTCNCTRGFVGRKCEMPESACKFPDSEGKPCINGGLCHLGHCEISASSHKNSVSLVTSTLPEQQFILCENAFYSRHGKNISASLPSYPAFSLWSQQSSSAPPFGPFTEKYSTWAFLLVGTVMLTVVVSQSKHAVAPNNVKAGVL